MIDFLADLDPPLFTRLVVAPIAESASSYRIEESDPLLRALMFVADVHLYISPVGTPADTTTPIPGNDREYTAVFIPGKDAMMKIWYRNNHPGLTHTVWEQISEPLYEDLPQPMINNTFSETLPVNTLLPLEHAKVREALREPRFRGLISAVLDHLTSSDAIEARGLSSNRIDKVIEAARADRDARAWIKGFLATTP